MGKINRQVCGDGHAEACAQRVDHAERGPPPAQPGALRHPAGAPHPTGSAGDRPGALFAFSKVRIAHRPQIHRHPGSGRLLDGCCTPERLAKPTGISSSNKGAAATASWLDRLTIGTPAHGPPGLRESVKRQGCPQGAGHGQGRQTARPHLAGPASGPPGRMGGPPKGAPKGGGQPGRGDIALIEQARQPNRGCRPALRCQNESATEALEVRSSPQKSWPRPVRITGTVPSSVPRSAPAAGLRFAQVGLKSPEGPEE